jgi:hypothetical protein
VDKTGKIDGVCLECNNEKTQQIQQNTAIHVVPHSSFSDFDKKRSHNGLPLAIPIPMPSAINGRPTVID